MSPRFFVCAWLATLAGLVALRWIQTWLDKVRLGERALDEMADTVALLTENSEMVATIETLEDQLARGTEKYFDKLETTE